MSFYHCLVWYKIKEITYYPDTTTPFQTDIGRMVVDIDIPIFRYFDILFWCFSKPGCCIFLQNRYDILVYCTALAASCYKSLVIKNLVEKLLQPLGAGLSKYRHQASRRNCAGTPSTLFGCTQQDPPTTPVLRKTPLKSFIVYTLVTLSTPSPES